MRTLLEMKIPFTSAVRILLVNGLLCHLTLVLNIAWLDGVDSAIKYLAKETSKGGWTFFTDYSPNTGNICKILIILSAEGSRASYASFL